MKKIIYIDMDNVLVDFKTGIDQLDNDTLIEYEGRLDEVPNIFSLMNSYNNAIESVEKLSEKYDLYKRLIISHHKNLNAGDYLIDDRPNNGAKDFKGEWIHFGSESFPDWNSVTRYLLSK